MSESEGDQARMTVPDEDLPEDLQPGKDNPLAGSSDDEAERQDLGDPIIGGLERDDDDNLTMPSEDDDED
jgi:hypothetical protein